MQLWPIYLLRQQGSTSAITTTTLISLLAGITVAPAAGSALALQPRFIPTLGLAASSAALVSASLPPTYVAAAAPVNVKQKIFRLGKPAADIKRASQALYSTMSSFTTPTLPQSNDFDQYKSTPHIDPTPETAQLVRDAQDLVSAKPSPAIFARSWSPSAIFADPICHAEGSRQYLAQWYGVPAAFSESETLAWKLVKQEPGEVQYAQKQRYKVKGLGMTKEIISTVVMERDAGNKITRFEDRWNHKPLGGYIGWPFRRLNALGLPFLVGVPKETKQALNHKDL